jgi:tight adherence protein B
MNLLQSPLLIAAAVVAGIGCAAFILYELLWRDRGQVKNRLAEEFGGAHGRTSRATLFKDLSRLAQEADAQATLRTRWELILEQADVNFSLRQLLLATLLSGVILSLVTLLATNSVIGAALAFMAGLMAPALYTLARRRQRIETLRRQLPDAFDIMSRSIRAGQTVTRAFQVVGDDFDPPLGTEFSWCFEQQNLGLPPDIALRDLARRTGVAELQMLVVALLVQRQSGGSPVELLENLALVVRKRNRLREKVKSLTAEGRMQAMVLLCIPPFVVGAVSFTNPDYMNALWAQPWLLAGMALSEIIGALWIRRIITFRY